MNAEEFRQLISSIIISETLSNKQKIDAIIESNEAYHKERVNADSLVSLKFMKWLSKEAPEVCESLWNCIHEYNLLKQQIWKQKN